MRLFLAVAAILFASVVPSLADNNLRTVWVLSDKPESLTLQFNGQTIHQFDPAWQHTGQGYMAQISFPVSELDRYQQLRLIRADLKGWSDWGPENIAFLKHSNVGKSDPACVGGVAWCAIRGL